jgi:hypothetical protein
VEDCGVRGGGRRRPEIALVGAVVVGHGEEEVVAVGKGRKWNAREILEQWFRFCSEDSGTGRGKLKMKEDDARSGVVLKFLILDSL